MRAEIERILSYFTKRPEVMALYIFGSFDTPFERADSDIDIAVFVSNENKKELDILKDEYYYASPSFSMRTIDIITLNAAPTYLKHRILKTGRILIDKIRLRGKSLRRGLCKNTLTTNRSRIFTLVD